MSELTVRVTRKGQVTIPKKYRDKYGIREGMRLGVKDGPRGIILRPVPRLEDLAGVDAGRLSPAKMRKKLDSLRMRDRY